jgi:hypothetical protein
MQTLPIKHSGSTASYMGHRVTGANPIAYLAQWMIEQGVSPEAFVQVNDSDTIRLRYWADQVTVDGDPSVRWCASRAVIENKPRREPFSFSGGEGRKPSSRSYAPCSA